MKNSALLGGIVCHMNQLVYADIGWPRSAVIPRDFRLFPQPLSRVFLGLLKQDGRLSLNAF
jgi:hypothetical protein